MNLFFMSTLIFVTLPGTHTKIFTLMDKHQSLVRITSRMWKQGAKFHFKILSDTADGTIFTVKGLQNAMLSMHIKNKRLTLELNGISHKFPGITNKILNRKNWYDILLKQSGAYLQLQVNNAMAMLPVIRNTNYLIDNWQNVMFGRNLYQNDIQAESIVGCIDLSPNFNSSTIDDYALQMHSTLNSCIDACAVQTCGNNGQCINNFNVGICDCRRTGYEGKTCEEEARAVMLNGKNYLTLEKNIFLKEIIANEVSFRFKTSESNGLLMLLLKKDDLLTVELHEGSLYITSITNEVYFETNIGVDLNDDQWHSFELKRSSNNLETKLDATMDVKAIVNNIQKFVKVTAKKDHLTVQFGGTDNTNLLSNLQTQNNFHGCLQQIYYDDEDVIQKVLHGYVHYTSHETLHSCAS